MARVGRERIIPAQQKNSCETGIMAVIVISAIQCVHVVAFAHIYFDCPQVVVPDIVMLKAKNYESGNKHHVEVITQGARDEIEQVKEHPEPHVGRCVTRFLIIIDSSGDDNQGAEGGGAKHAIDKNDRRC